MKKAHKKELTRINNELFDLVNELEAVADEIDEESVHDVDPDYETLMQAVDRIHDARSYVEEAK